MPSCFFATDLHGNMARYDKFVRAILKERPQTVFLAGDLLPGPSFTPPVDIGQSDFVDDYLVPVFSRLRDNLREGYPEIFLILGNDDPRCKEESFAATSVQGLWQYAHAKKLAWRSYPIYGFAYVPPTPFLLKDWECYDVSRYVPPGCISPEEGRRTVAADESRIKWITIQQELDLLVGQDPLDHSIFLFHSPPYDTALDRAALDGMTYEHVPLDVHVGSIAIRRFIEARQPLLSLHGHVHEAARLTGEWKIRLGKTVCINGAHDGPELALVRFDLESPWEATRELL